MLGMTDVWMVSCGCDGGLWLEQVWKDPGLRPVARTRTKTGLTGEVRICARERGWSDLGS